MAMPAVKKPHQSVVKNSPEKRLQISQDAFDSVVKENVEDLGMEEAEAVADALAYFQLKGVDLAGIISSSGGSASLEQHPVVIAIQALEKALAAVVGGDLKAAPNINFHDREANLTPELESEIESGIHILRSNFTGEHSDSVAVAQRNGGLEVLVAACKILTACRSPSLEGALATICAILTDDRARETFRLNSGPQMVSEALLMDTVNHRVVQHGAATVATASVSDEDVKDQFMSLKVHQVLVEHLKRYQTYPDVVHRVCDALRSLTTADDERIAASRAFQNAMLIAKEGAVDALLEVAQEQVKSTASLPSLCIALKNVAANDEICKALADKGGLELIMTFMAISKKQNHKVMARSVCILLTQVSGSDTNKDKIVQHLGGLPEIVNLVTHFAGEVTVVREALTALSALTLRSPVNASQAVSAGVVDVTAEAMEEHSRVGALQRQACQVIRNLAVRNPENRPIILEKGLEKLIREAKVKHAVCGDVASAALRDLGFDDYNL